MYGLGEQMRQVNVESHPTEVNGQPGPLVLDPDGRLINVFSVDIADGAVQVIRSVINPDKLQHLGPLADIGALMSQRTRR
jgi:RNA polymerase sigma-70 factor (ECF subfamily)